MSAERGNEKIEAAPLFITLLLLGIITPAPAGEFGYDSIFSQAFGKQQEQTLPSQMDVPLRIDGEEGDQVHVYTDNGKVRVAAPALLEQLDKAALPKVIAALKPAINSDNALSQAALEKVGLTAVFNNSDLAFDVSIPFDLQKPKELRLFKGRRPQVDPQSLLKPARVSGYLNLRTGLEYQQTESGDTKKSGRKPIRAQWDGALNIRGVVLENQLTYSEAAARQWARDHTRLVRDGAERLWRCALGDVSYPTRGFQSGLPMAGFSLAKNFQLDPYQVFHARGEQSFILAAESEVEIFSNGFSIRKLNLSPGEYHRYFRSFFQTN